MIAKTMICTALLTAPIAGAQDDVAMQAMKDELARTMSQIRLQVMEKPYFVAYRLDNLNRSAVSASLGSLIQDEPARVRLIGVEIRVGDMNLDNTNFVSARSFAGGPAGIIGGIRQATLDDNYQQIRRAFWMATDAQYKKVLEDLSAKRAALEAQNQTARPPDFTAEPPSVKLQPLADATIPADDMKKLTRDLSAVFKSMPDLYDSSVDIEYMTSNTRYVNSEGSIFTRSQQTVKLKVNARVQAADGFPIADTIDLFGHSLADLPQEADLIARTRAMGERILKLRSASTLERYNGPVLFEGEAAPEIFAQQFASGLSAERVPLSDQTGFVQFFNQMLDQLGGHSFGDKIGGRVLPDFLDVTDNPTVSKFEGLNLMGDCEVDDDAVKTRETKLVEHGRLKTLLSTRVPTDAISRSTGSRRGWGAAPSNLLVTTEQATTEADLRKQLLQLANDRGLKYGIVVRHIGGGSAAQFIRMAARMMQQGGQVDNSMAEVYKLYPDRHEELVQGVEIAEMNPAAFKDIVAVGDTPAVYSDEYIPRIGALFSVGLSSASQVPVVTYVAPSMLFEELTLDKTQGPHPSLPVEPSPLAK
jgi:predicted Zn-dependent protease